MRVIIGCYFGTFVRTGVFDYLNVTERKPRYSPHHHLKMENYIILYSIDGLIIYTYFLFFSFFITRCSGPFTCASTNFGDHKHTNHPPAIHLDFLSGYKFQKLYFNRLFYWYMISPYVSYSHLWSSYASVQIDNVNHLSCGDRNTKYLCPKSL